MKEKIQSKNTTLIAGISILIIILVALAIGGIILVFGLFLLRRCVILHYFCGKVKTSKREMHQSASRELGPNLDGFYILAEKERGAEEDTVRTQFR